MTDQQRQWATQLIDRYASYVQIEPRYVYGWLCEAYSAVYTGVPRLYDSRLLDIADPDGFLMHLLNETEQQLNRWLAGQQTPPAEPTEFEQTIGYADDFSQATADYLNSLELGVYSKEWADDISPATKPADREQQLVSKSEPGAFEQVIGDNRAFDVEVSAYLRSMQIDQAEESTD